MKFKKSAYLNTIIKTALIIIVSAYVAPFSSQLHAAIRSASTAMPFGDSSAENLFRRATDYQEREKLDSALICYSWLIETYRSSDNPETLHFVGKALSETGQIYYIHFNYYAEAYRSLAEAESILAESDDHAAHATVLLNLGNLFNMYEYIFPNDNRSVAGRSRDYYMKALKMGKDNGNWNMVCSSFINISMMDLPFKVNDEINSRMKALLKDSIPDSTEDYRLTLTLCDGMEAISRKDYKKAREIMTAMRDSIGLTNPRERYMANVCLSAVSLAEGKYDEAINCIKGILSDDSGINDADVHMEIYDFLSKYYALAGNEEQSALYRIKYYEAKDSLMSRLVALEPTRIGLELDNVRENARRIEADSRYMRLWLVFFGLIMIVLTVIAVVIYRKNRQLKLKNKIIFSQTQSLINAPTKTDESKTVRTDSSGSAIKSPDETKIIQEKYRDSSMTDETRKELIVKIEAVMENIDEICDKNFSLQRLTALVGSNTSYISRIVNEHYGMTFGNLLNQYRLKEACRRMGDTERYGNLTIEAISESVGFNTRSTFTKAFRLNIGMLPSEYVRLLKTKP